jgi:undecaprenyl-diphosphatase
MVFLTMISEVAAFWWVTAAVLLIFGKKIGSYVPGLALAAAVAAAFMVRNVAAYLIARPRPPLTEENVRQLVELPIADSFPSGHAASSFAAMYVLVYFFPSAKYWAIPLAVIFAYTRLYVGMHFPLDSLAGALLGIISAAVTTKLIVTYAAKKKIPSTAS